MGAWLNELKHTPTVECHTPVSSGLVHPQPGGTSESLCRVEEAGNALPPKRERERVLRDSADMQLWKMQTSRQEEEQRFLGGA